MEIMKTIAVDFDGVIHKYSKGWQDGSIYDTEITLVFDSIKQLFDEGYSVFIFSTRSPRQIRNWIRQNIMETDYDINGLGGDPTEYITAKYGYTCKVIPFWKKFWNEKNVLGVTKRKLPAHIYIDDRALKFEGDWLQTLELVKTFKTYQE